MRDFLNRPRQWNILFKFCQVVYFHQSFCDSSSHWMTNSRGELRETTLISEFFCFFGWFFFYDGVIYAYKRSPSHRSSKKRRNKLSHWLHHPRALYKNMNVKVLELFVLMAFITDRWWPLSQTISLWHLKTQRHKALQILDITQSLSSHSFIEHCKQHFTSRHPELTFSGWHDLPFLIQSSLKDELPLSSDF